MSAASLTELIGGADASRISAAVDQLRARLDEGVFLDRAVAEVLVDCSAEERLGLLRVLGVPAEREELVVERLRASGASFLEGSPEEQDEALLAAFPELAGDGGEEYELV